MPILVAIVRHPTDPKHIIKVFVAGVPVPSGDCTAVLDVDSHQGATNGLTGRKRASAVWRCVRVYGACLYFEICLPHISKVA